MTFFQNPFAVEFRGNWVLGDRKLSLTFDCPQNTGRGPQIVQSYGLPPFNLSGNDVDGNPTKDLNINFALDSNSFKNWATISVDMTTATGTVTTAVTIAKIVASLNANTKFAAYFTASQKENWVLITQKLSETRFKFYILNGQGESVLLFNKFAGVEELPTYFSRHSIDNRFNFDDANNILVELDVAGKDVDAAVVNNAVDIKGKNKGYDATSPKEDWELLRGRSGIFISRKTTVDGSDRPEEVIEYSTGALAGDLAKKIIYTYTSDNETPDEVIEIPYTLTGSDLISP